MAKRKILTDALPMIYCYTIPGYTPKVGWCKIGYTEKNGAILLCMATVQIPVLQTTTFMPTLNRAASKGK